MMLLGIDWFVVEDSSRKTKLVVSLYVVGFCFMYNIHEIFPTNEIARNKICSVDLLNGHEWRKVGCIVENKLEFRQ
jgi:hypothetical protein